MNKEQRQKLLQAKEDFVAAYQQYVSQVFPGGINGIGIGLGICKGSKQSEVGISVRIETDHSLLNILPDTFQGVPVFKHIIGKIEVL